MDIEQLRSEVQPKKLMKIHHLKTFHILMDIADAAKKAVEAACGNCLDCEDIDCAVADLKAELDKFDAL